MNTDTIALAKAAYLDAYLGVQDAQKAVSKARSQMDHYGANARTSQAKTEADLALEEAIKRCNVAGEAYDALREG